MLKLLSLAVTMGLVALIVAPSAHTYTALKGTTTTYTLAPSACLQQTCAPMQQPMIGQAYGYAQPMPYPCPPRKVTKCKAPAFNPCAPSMPPCGPTCVPAPPCGPMPCPPPCNQPSAWDRLITNLWY